MKTSLFVLAVIAATGISTMPSYADEMAMPMSATQAHSHSHEAIVGTGTVVSENKTAGKVTLQHESIPAIGWGAMTMEFKVKDKMLLDKVKKGDKVRFTLLQDGKNYVITNIK